MNSSPMKKLRIIEARFYCKDPGESVGMVLGNEDYPVGRMYGAFLSSSFQSNISKYIDAKGGLTINVRLTGLFQ